MRDLSDWDKLYRIAREEGQKGNNVKIVCGPTAEAGDSKWSISFTPNKSYAPIFVSVCSQNFSVVAEELFKFLEVDDE